MRTFILTFLAGILTLQLFHHLPSMRGVILLLIFFIAIKYTFKKYSTYTTIILYFLLGFTWCLYFANLHRQWIIPEALEGKTVEITGSIHSIPDISKYNTAFTFRLQSFNHQPASGLVKLSWRNIYFPLHVGDQWCLTVHLKKIHSTMNPGGFDYEAFALQEGIRATGYVITKSFDNKLLASHWYQSTLNRLRQTLKEKIEKNLPHSNTSAWIIALALGERHGIAQENWEVLRNTGTNHLMAIAGLHIGFMSGFAFSLFSMLWRRVPRFMLIMPAQHAGSIAALFMAFIYSALAGFSIPTQRACIMLTTFLVMLLFKRKLISWQAWFIALFIVLMLNPLDVLDASFWLSFGSVALIIYGVSGRVSPQGLWWKLGRIQWVVTLGLIPLSIWLFQQCSIVSFLANSIAIPSVGFVIVPLCLLGCFAITFSAKLGGWMLMLDDKLLSVLWKILSFFSHVSWSSWYQVVPEHWIILSACVGVLLLLLPIGFSGRWIGLIWLLPMFLYKPSIPKEGDVWFTLLDVGQGLSAVVQTQHHLLVFDTGARLSDSFDMGASAVVPFLRVLNAKKLDMLVISHGDNDHSGGAQTVISTIPVNSIKTSVPELFTAPQTSLCLQGQSWSWDGVDFSFLYPSPDKLGLDNDSSCVLRITAGNKHILLTGDIEKFAEKYLVATQRKNLSADILVAPHHGSKTSAISDFVTAVNPKIVLYPVGYRNRYHFPNPNVVATYQHLGAHDYDSVTAGAITFKISKNSEQLFPELYRMIQGRFWNS